MPIGRMLAACGCSPALFDDSDGTSKREALRQWHLGTVKPLARLLEAELSAKLETRVRLNFDLVQRRSCGPGSSLSKAGCRWRGCERSAGDFGTAC